MNKHNTRQRDRKCMQIIRLNKELTHIFVLVFKYRIIKALSGMAVKIIDMK